MSGEWGELSSEDEEHIAEAILKEGLATFLLEVARICDNERIAIIAEETGENVIREDASRPPRIATPEERRWRSRRDHLKQCSKSWQNKSGRGG